MRIGIFGGAFDPPHTGHLMVIAQVLATVPLDKVVVVPCWNHAFGKQMTDFRHRFAMAKRAFKFFGPIRVHVSPIEKDLKTRYTVDLIRAFKEQMPVPEDELFLILGEDEWNDRLKWHQWEEIP